MGKTVASQLNVVLVADTGEWTMGIEKATASTRKFEAAAKAAARSQAIDQISSPPSRTPNVTASNSIYAQQAAQAEQAIAAQKEIARTRSAQAAQDARSAQIAREASSAWTQRDVTAEKAIADKRAETAAKIAAINAKVASVSGGSRFDNANPFAQQVMATQKLNALMAQRKTLTDSVERAESRLAITRQVAEVREIRANLTAGSAINIARNLGNTAADNQGKYARFGVVMQQAGYQVQDFAVQVAGGQNALVALSQQGSQMLGVFGVGGAIAGAALSVGVLVSRLFTMKDGAEEAAKGFKTLEEATKGAIAASREYDLMRNPQKEQIYLDFDTSGSLANLTKAQKESAAAREKIAVAQKKLDEASSIKGMDPEAKDLMIIRLTSRLEKATGESDVALKKLSDAEVAFKKSKGVSEKPSIDRNREAESASPGRIKEYTAQFEANQELTRSDQTRLSLIYDQMDALANLGQTGTLAFAQLENASMTLERQINNTRNAETQAAHDRTKAYADAVKANEDLFKTDQQRLDAMDKQIEAMANMGEVGTVAFVNLQGQAEMLAKSIREKGIATLNGLSSRVPQSLGMSQGVLSSGLLVGSASPNQLIEINRQILEGIRKLVSMEAMASRGYN